jgi:hypothetical protein
LVFNTSFAWFYWETCSITACTNTVNRNDRALLKFNSAAFRTPRMLAEKYFLYTSQLYNRCHALQWNSCALENPANAEICRQFSNAYLNFSNANALLSGRNVIVARPTALVATCSWSPGDARIKVPTSIENNGDEQQHLCAALRWRSFLAALSSAVQHHERLVEPPGPLAKTALNPRQASSKERRQISVLLCSLQQILPSSLTTSFSLLWRGVSLLYETRTTPGRALNSRAVQQGQPRIKRCLCLALVGALELITAADWNILISLLNIGLGDSRVQLYKH